MGSKRIYRLQAYLDNIGILCRLLDILASPNIEKELDVCIDDYLFMYIETLINSDETESILGKTGLQVLHKLHAIIPEGCCYRKGEGFSTTQQWIDFVDYTKIANTLLKDSVKRYEETNNDFL
jgi:hypothetical protein